MNDDDLLDLAYPYALDALDEAAQRDVDARLAASAPDTREEFERIVAQVRETMAAMSSSTALAPPPSLRDNVLLAIEEPRASNVIPMRRRWQLIGAGVAAVFALLVGSIVVVNQLRPSTEITLAQEVAQAPDRQVKTLEVGGGILQVTFSRQLDAAVLHMEEVALAPEGKTYQLWLIEDETPKSGGLMKDPNGDTTVADLGNTNALALTIEPDGGSTLPTTEPIAVANI